MGKLPKSKLKKYIYYILMWESGWVGAEDTRTVPSPGRALSKQGSPRFKNCWYITLFILHAIKEQRHDKDRKQEHVKKLFNIV